MLARTNGHQKKVDENVPAPIEEVYMDIHSVLVSILCIFQAGLNVLMRAKAS